MAQLGSRLHLKPMEVYHWVKGLCRGSHSEAQSIDGTEHMLANMEPMKLHSIQPEQHSEHVKQEMESEITCGVNTHLLGLKA